MLAKKKVPLRTSDVFSDSSSEDEYSTTTTTATNVSCITPVSYDALQIGIFVVVNFALGNKKEKSKNYIGVVQSNVDEEREVKVMFLKMCDNNKYLYCCDENDVSYICYDQIIGILPVPSLLVKGDRVFYKFDQEVLNSVIDVPH